MSQENVTLAQRIYERWIRERRIDPSDFHTDFDLRTPLVPLANPKWRGFDGYKEWRASAEEVAADDWFEAEGFEDLGSERVLVTGWLHFKGKSSGVETRERAVQLWTFRDGKASSMTSAWTLEQALDAAGLSE